MNITPEQKVFDVLNGLGIKFVQYEHPAVYTVEQANQHWQNISGLHCKNLFLRDKKGRKHYLVVVESSKTVDIKALNSQLEERLSFASPQRLMKYLGLEPGSVSPFGLINDADKAVHVILDEDIKQADQVNFHPNVNTITLGISRTDFDTFLRNCGNTITYCTI